MIMNHSWMTASEAATVFKETSFAFQNYLIKAIYKFTYLFAVYLMMLFQ
jgi:hypothetical protein